MAELKGIPLGTHLKAITSELRAHQRIYGYPRRKFFTGFEGYDFSVPFHEKEAATPLGPASGPHTQLAQNIVLAFLGGARIIELKTVQVLDRLEIPRPCIYAPNIGFNVEWSQELTLDESYQEYVTAWVLIKLIEEMELLEVPKGSPFYRTIFDVSVGYDLKGITSDRVSQWLRHMRDASAAIETMLRSLSPEFSQFRKFPVDPYIADSVTLSTFHGCPRDEIESIVQYLIAEQGFHVIVKMNPTLLGYDAVREILIEQLGYSYLELDPQAFAHDLQFDEAVDMMKRLQVFARQHGKRVGAKFTNTLVVKNNQDFFKDEVMYLSGTPLHVLAMHAAYRFRRALGDQFPISFSAGISRYNFADAVRCHLTPITVCTDLLKTGGYTRLFDYLKQLKTEMEALGVNTIQDYILRSSEGNEEQTVAAAGMANMERYVSQLVQDPRYHYSRNQKNPPKVDSHLSLFDCLTCNKCLSVCPNAANFAIPSEPGERTVHQYHISGDHLEYSPSGTFQLEKSFQIANIADWCNECGNCDTYCPEHGGPFIEKPRFFLNAETYRKFRKYDGFYFPDRYSLQGRLNGEEYLLRFDPEKKTYYWKTRDAEIWLNATDQLINWQVKGNRDVLLTLEPYHIFKTLLQGFLNDPANYPAIVLLASR
ncbi:MAG: glutamate synthase [Calditrichaeota bacterium]|nr:glutamate synthase [Calditrichota bacterium]